MAAFIVLWPYLLTTKHRCLQKNNIGHTNLPPFASTSFKSSQNKFLMFAFSASVNVIGTLDTSLIAETFFSVTYLTNTLYGCETNIVFTVKMESVPKYIIFDLQTMVKSGLEKNILKVLHAGTYFPLLHKIPKITFSVTKTSSKRILTTKCNICIFKLIISRSLD